MQRATRKKTNSTAAAVVKCFLNETVQSTRRPVWNKVILLNASLHRRDCDVSIWIDNDVLFLRPFNVSRLLRPHKTMAFAIDAGGLNAGFVAMRRSQISTDFLHHVWGAYSKHAPFPEQSAMRAVLTRKQFENTFELARVFGYPDSRGSLMNTSWSDANSHVVHLTGNRAIKHKKGDLARIFLDKVDTNVTSCEN